MSGREFLQVAKKLSRSKGEASLRSAISRAYYALFNVASQYLGELGFTVEKGPGGHGHMHYRLSNSGVEQMIKFSQVLNAMRRQRNNADYDMNAKDFQNQTTCALWIARAELAVTLLDKCDKEPLRSQVRAGIRDYDAKTGKKGAP